MKVLLLSPPYSREYMRNARCDYISLSHSQWYPVWLSYCGALLEKEGFRVKIIDALAYSFGYQQTQKMIEDFKPELLVVYSSTKSEASDINFTEEMMKHIGCEAVFVGPFVSINPEAILKKSRRLRFAIKGEFEYPVLELVKGYSPFRIKNLLYRSNGQIISNENRPLLNTEQLDQLPFVTEFYKRHLDLRKYHIPQELFPFVDLFTGRGCYWGQCSFCLWVHSFIPGRTYNKRTISNVIKEIRAVKENIPQAKEIFIQDDSMPQDRATELSEALLKENLGIIWSCYLRADVDYPALRLMRQAGCRNVHVGYESASNTVLRNARKGLTVERMTEFTKDAQKAGLHVHGDFVFGLKGELRESARKTIQWAKELKLDTAQFSIMNIYPHTPFYDYLAQNGFIKDNEPNYPRLSNRELRKWAKRGYRKFYLRGNYLASIFRHPYKKVLVNINSIFRMLPNIFWKRW